GADDFGKGLHQAVGAGQCMPVIELYENVLLAEKAGIAVEQSVPVVGSFPDSQQEIVEGNTLTTESLVRVEGFDEGILPPQVDDDARVEGAQHILQHGGHDPRIPESCQRVP